MCVYLRKKMGQEILDVNRTDLNMIFFKLSSVGVYGVTSAPRRSSGGRHSQELQHSP